MELGQAVISLSRCDESAAWGLECSLELNQPLAYKRVPHPFSPTITSHETGVAQHFQVVAHGWLTLAEGLDEIADTHLALVGVGKDRKDPEAGRVGERRKALSQLDGVFGVEGCVEH